MADSDAFAEEKGDAKNGDSKKRRTFVPNVAVGFTAVSRQEAGETRLVDKCDYI